MTIGLNPMPRQTPRFAWLVTGLTMIACSKTNNIDQSTTNNSVTQIVGPEGARVESPSGASVDIPPGALTQDTEISISDLASGEVGAPPPGFVYGGTPFSFEPHGQTFALDVVITVPHELGTAAGAAMLRSDPGSDWAAIPTTSETATTVQASTTTFSYYVVAQGGDGGGGNGGGGGGGGGGTCTPADSEPLSGAGCQWPLSTLATVTDADLVNVEIVTSSMQVLSMTRTTADGGASCTANLDWYYDDDANPTEILFCPNSCDALTADPGAVANVLTGCPSETM